MERAPHVPGFGNQEVIEKELAPNIDRDRGRVGGNRLAGEQRDCPAPRRGGADEIPA
jgi:hypothetical protein